ncbi:hypothetical protein C8A00DRAFT_38551 [Chaetomidium leptoderma]|uniref:NACHT domain-containing protein n=1 Tax=Chaetomidium leptoderma TaxID=669021 RepID=A0AAN6VCG2_9PEZI|nr:hypothetical protein C8A00DRAFT_38551 [Chaetomidium leptoderma]
MGSAAPSSANSFKTTAVSPPVFWTKSRAPEEAALLVALAESTKPVCVFLDGLDEVTNEEQGRTLDLVDKMCSRTRLRNVPALRLQDLTREDIKQYVSGALGSAFDAGDPEFRDLVEKICNKSDGVFLWVSLAIKSLQRGNRDENTLEELEKRLETLPKDLHQLYESMWHRLNDDEAIYREDGAQFLNYALGYEDIGFGLDLSLLMCTIDQLTLAREGCLRRKILEENYSPLVVEWIPYVRKTARQLEIRSAGLLEITRNMWGEPSARLIHRSAKEFLENTPRGQQILQYDKSTAEDRMSNIILATIALQHPGVVQHGHHVAMQQTSLSEILEGIRRLSQQSRLSSAKVFEVMRHAKAFFQTGLWVSSHRRSLLHLITPLLPQRDRCTLPRAKPNGLPAPLRPDLDFLAIAVRAGFLDFVAPTLDELEKSSATGPLHAAYKGHLVTTACEGASYQLIGHRIAMAEYLLRRWSNTGLGHWGFYFPETIDQDYMHRCTVWGFTSPEIVDQDFMQPCTPIMAVCRLAFAAPRLCWVWESLECMLRNGEGGTLDDLTTVMFVERPQPKSMKGAGPHSPGSPGDAAASDNWSVELHALNTNQTIPPGKRYLLLEANMSYVFGLHQKLQGRISDTTAQEACNLAAAEIARHKVTKTAKVWLVGDGERDPLNFYRPVSDAESSYLLEPFLNISAQCYPEGRVGLLRTLASRPDLARRIKVLRLDFDGGYAALKDDGDRAFVLELAARYGWAPSLENIVETEDGLQHVRAGSDRAGENR